jgi:hypothetical protein
VSVPTPAAENGRRHTIRRLSAAERGVPPESCHKPGCRLPAAMLAELIVAGAPVLSWRKCGPHGTAFAEHHHIPVDPAPTGHDHQEDTHDHP